MQATLRGLGFRISDGLAISSTTPLLSRIYQRITTTHYDLGQLGGYVTKWIWNSGWDGNFSYSTIISMPGNVHHLAGETDLFAGSISA
ncbi:unnamed protein product [Calypogeia fissa]